MAGFLRRLASRSSVSGSSIHSQSTAPSLQPQFEDVFTYEPLNLAEDSVRLIALLPRRPGKKSTMVECTLSLVRFGDMPKYEALSYAWGKDTEQHAILINGSTFMVGSNLFAALINLRGIGVEDKPRVLWVDAICINQFDIEERSRTVRLMPYIYSRAQRVVVWLGSQDTHKEDLKLEHELQRAKAPKRKPFGHISDWLRKSIITVLCQKPYWQRLWIIQEIGKARDIRVYFGTHQSIKGFSDLAWRSFIDHVKVHSPEIGRRALKLDLQLNDKYGEAHQLRTLLETHQDALCQEPRDKIYGLLGLATDISDDYPIDYNRSLIRVWADAILFQNSIRGKSQHDILTFCKLVAWMLGGQTIFQQGLPLVIYPSDEPYWLDTVQSIIVSTSLLGRIGTVGPSYSEIMGSVRSANEWKRVIRESVPNDSLLMAYEQSDFFLQNLERFNEVGQTNVFAFPNSPVWGAAQQYSLQNYQTFRGTQVRPSAMQSSQDPNQQYLFLLELPALEHAVSWMGLGSYGIQTGDLICQISGLERALIVRQTPIPGSSPASFRHQLIGCAGLARDNISARSQKAAVHQGSIFCVERFSALGQFEKFDVSMDLYTAQMVAQA